MKTDELQIRLEPELTKLVNQAVRRTGLTKSEVLRQGLRKGVPKIPSASGGRRKKGTLLDALLAMKGLEIPERHCPFGHRVNLLTEE